MTDREPTPAPLSATSAEQASGPSGEVADDAASPAAREKWDSAELLGDRIEILIQHGSEVYRLRRTRQDKLILYK